MERLDTNGLKCPMPVLKARRQLAMMQPGDALLIIADDPATVHDMPAFCEQAGHRLKMAAEGEGYWEYTVIRGDQAPK